MKAADIRAGQSRDLAAWRMAILAFLINNVAIGVAYGGYGVSVLAIAQKFSVSRATAALPMSFIILAVTVLAPFLGAIFRRISIRRTILVGQVFCVVGYLILAMTTDWRIMLATYLFVVGPGVAASGFMPANVLVSNWFVHSQGKALGLTNMTLFIMLIPIIAIAILQNYGLSAVYLFQALTTVLAMPIAFMLIDRPSDVGRKAVGEDLAEDRPAIEAPTLTPVRILSTAAFWMLVLGSGILTGSGTTKLAHMVPLLTEQGHPVTEASFLLAISGGAGMIGSLLFGFLADRFGAAWSLVLNGFSQAAMWSLLLLPLSLPILIVDAVVMGICGAGLVSAQGVLFTHIFGQRNFGMIMGMISLATLPFLVGMAPLIGYLRDISGTYHSPVAVLVALASGAGFVFLWMALRRTDNIPVGLSA